MKTTFALLAVAAGAVAQSLTDLPTCGQTCVGNMIQIASADFGCKVGDVTCYCTNQRFGYGVRDCANEACPPDQAAKVIEFGASYCQNALQSAGGSTDAAAASSTGALAPLTSALASATATGEGASSTPVSTQALVGTVTSDGSTFETTTGFSTIYGGAAGAASSAVASATDSAGSAIASATESAASAISSAASAASSAADSAASAASSAAESGASAASSAVRSGASAASSAAESATAPPSNAAPMMTAAPMAGAIGIAALLLI